ncbi:uncharacterized protein V1510DRAFT_178703 [Dipodascopsis tothii]|uniref:uncharacterized protein n=1 Tax=Dipodascopsis tothii TaxID=44089 RepID=UPI0034CF3310
MNTGKKKDMTYRVKCRRPGQYAVPKTSGMAPQDDDRSLLASTSIYLDQTAAVTAAAPQDGSATESTVLSGTAGANTSTISVSSASSVSTTTTSLTGSVISDGYTLSTCAGSDTSDLALDDAGNTTACTPEDSISDLSNVTSGQYTSNTFSTPSSRQSGTSEMSSTPGTTPFISDRDHESKLDDTRHPVFSFSRDDQVTSNGTYVSQRMVDDREEIDPFTGTQYRPAELGCDLSRSASSALSDAPAMTSGPSGGNYDSASRSIPVTEVSRSHPSACLFVASLPSAQSLENLRNAVLEIFAKWNPIDVTAHRDSSDRPYAFVQLRSYEDARDALRERRGSLVFDRPIRCEHARVNRALFLTSSTNSLISREDAERIFQKYGQLEMLIFSTITHGRNVLHGWCAKFEYREDAISAYLELRSNTNYQILYVQNPDPRIPVSADNPTLYIRGIDLCRVTKSQLEERFSKYGTILDIEILRQQPSDMHGSGMDSGAATIRFAGMEEARIALARERTRRSSWTDEFTSATVT